MNDSLATPGPGAKTHQVKFDVPSESTQPSTSGQGHLVNGDAGTSIPEIRTVSPDRTGCCCFSRRSSGRPKVTPPAHPPAREIIRLLMVGRGDVGKSTVIKQLQNLCKEYPQKYVMYDETWTTRKATFSLEERRQEKQQVLRNILHCIGTLLNKVEDYGFPFDNDQNRQIALRVQQEIGDVDGVLRLREVHFTGEMARDIAILWKDQGVQRAWDKRREYDIPDHATQYFLDSQRLEEIAHSDYVPTADDIIRARNPTRGTRDYNFEIEGTKFSFRDMGGQPAEIGRFPVVVTDWLNECEDSSRKYILFVASLADYNQRLPDRPPKYTSLVESIRLMQILMNIENLRNTGFILFLNKRDILQEKLTKFNDFAEHFPHAQPRHQEPHQSKGSQKRPPQPPSAEDAERIIGSSFHSAAQDTMRRDRPLYMHFTCATDKAQMDGIIGAVRVDILFKYMQTGIPFP